MSKLLEVFRKVHDYGYPDKAYHEDLSPENIMSPEQGVQATKALIQELVDETFDKDDAKAYEFWQKVKEL